MRRDVWWVALLAFASACLVSTNIWENGDIQLKWWAIRAWADFQFPDFPPNHHNMRWGMTIPAVAWVRLFGGGGLSYLLLNHVVFALTTAGLYALVRQLTTPLVAALALGVWLVNPITQSLPSNLMPELYSIAYPLAALLVLRHAYATGSRWSYVWAVVLMFAAYGAKETNVFFMPGWGLYELFRRRWGNVALMVAVFGACVLVETVAVNALMSESHIWLGRAQAILQAGHLDEMSTDWIYQPIDLITRWGFIAETNLDRLEFFPKALYWAFFIVSAWKGWRWLRARTLLPPPGELGPNGVAGGEVISVAWAMGLSFAFFTTFFVLSLDPLILGQPLNDRYLWPLLLPAIVVLSVALKAGLARAEIAGAGFLGFVGAAQRLAAPWVSGRAALVGMAAIAAACTLARWPIELGSTMIRRHGFAPPYATFGAQNYYDLARQRLLDGCTLVFSRPRPAQAVLIHAFDFRDIAPPLDLYDQRLESLSVRGRRLRGWSVPRSEWPLLAGKLYVEPDNAAFRPFALRLEGGACARTYYMGQGDIHPRDQDIEGQLAPPPPVSP